MPQCDQMRLDLMHRYWNAANYLTVGQIYLQENPLLRSLCVLNRSNHACLGIGERHPASISSMSTSIGLFRIMMSI